MAENLLNRNFKREQPNEAYVGDITYIRTREGWLYLSVFIDLHSRAVVGWSMRDRMTASLVTDSLMAMWKRRPVEGLLVHSDRGSQYVSESSCQITKPELLILDEPTEGIQLSIIKDIQSVIGMLRDRGEMAILLVEQFFEFARDLADSYVMLDRGEAALAGTSDSMDEVAVRRLMTV